MWWDGFKIGVFKDLVPKRGYNSFILILIVISNNNFRHTELSKIDYYLLFFFLFWMYLLEELQMICTAHTVFLLQLGPLFASTPCPVKASVIHIQHSPSQDFALAVCSPWGGHLPSTGHKGYLFTFSTLVNSFSRNRLSLAINWLYQPVLFFRSTCLTCWPP